MILTPNDTNNYIISKCNYNLDQSTLDFEVLKSDKCDRECFIILPIKPKPKLCTTFYNIDESNENYSELELKSGEDLLVLLKDDNFPTCPISELLKYRLKLFRIWNTVNISISDIHYVSLYKNPGLTVDVIYKNEKKSIDCTCIDELKVVTGDELFLKPNPTSKLSNDENKQNQCLIC